MELTGAQLTGVEPEVFGSGPDGRLAEVGEMPDWPLYRIESCTEGKSVMRRKTKVSAGVARSMMGAVMVVCALGMAGGSARAKTPRVVNAGGGDRGVVDDTPYYGGFGTGFLHVNADGTYGNGEIRSGEMGLQFYGPSFGGPYRFQLYVRHPAGEWCGDLVADAASGVRVDYLPLFPKCQYQFAHDAVPLDLKMEAFAPWIPGDSKMSSLPVLFFDFKLTNPDAAEKTVALAFRVPDPECGGGQPMIEKQGQVAGVLLQSQRAGGGTLCGMVRNDGDAQVTWGADFAKGKLNGLKGNLLASSIVMPAKSTRHVVFLFAWDFPGLRLRRRSEVAAEGTRALSQQFLSGRRCDRAGLPGQVSGDPRRGERLVPPHVGGEQLAPADAAANPHQHVPHGL